MVLETESYKEPFTGKAKVQFSDTDECDERFIRAYADEVIILSEAR
jgi:hypothetical protein